MTMYRKLGRSGITVSALGMGCWAIGGPFTRMGDRPMGWGDVDDAESIRAIHAAIDRGVTLFDTANNYGAGHSERVLGRALRDQRDKVVIATKFGSIFDETKRQHLDNTDVEYDEAFIRDALEGSLRRLDTDTIDLYQFHVGDYPPEKAGDVREVLEKLVDEGAIRAYGWSTDSTDRARVFAEGEHCAAIQHELSVLEDAPAMLALCAEAGVASINKSPLVNGVLTGKFTPGSTFPENDLRHGIDFSQGRPAQLLQQTEALREVLAADGRTLAQGALGWIWARAEHTIPIPGFKTVAQVEDNAGAMEHGPLSDAQMRQIDAILDRETV